MLEELGNLLNRKWTPVHFVTYLARKRLYSPFDKFRTTATLNSLLVLSKNFFFNIIFYFFLVFFVIFFLVEDTLSVTFLFHIPNWSKVYVSMYATRYIVFGHKDSHKESLVTIAQSFYIDNEGPIENILPVRPIELNIRSVLMDLDKVAGISNISEKTYEFFQVRTPCAKH